MTNMRFDPFNQVVADVVGVEADGTRILREHKGDDCMIVPYRKKRANTNDLYKNSAKARTVKPFVFVKTDTGKNFDDLNFETTWRLLVLSTYLRYADNPSEDATLVLGSGRGAHPMSKKEMRAVLNLSPMNFSRFLNAVCPVDENGVVKEGMEGRTCYLYHSNGQWKINNEYFVRGKLPRGKSTHTSRAFIEQIRRLHNAAKQSQHKQLGMIAKLLPWVNREYNIICIDREEEEREAVVPLTPKQIAEVLSLDSSNSEKTIGGVKLVKGEEILYGNLYKTLLNIELEIGGKNQTFCAALTTKYGSSLIVNPAFFYSGKKETELRLITSDFVAPKDRGRLLRERKKLSK